MVVAWTQFDTCDKWFRYVCGGVRKDIYQLYCQYDKLNWVCPTRKKLIRSAVLGNTQLCQRQTLPKIADKGFLVWGTLGNVLLEAAEGKDSQSRDKEEEDVAPAPAVTG